MAQSKLIIYDVVALCDRNLQSKFVQSEVTLICNGWQASNTDGYFAVTGHWIEEPHPRIWELHSALFGFVQLNNAHNGKRLCGALFKIIDRLWIAHKASAH